jgi:hypothetical protein
MRTRKKNWIADDPVLFGYGEARLSLAGYRGRKVRTPESTAPVNTRLAFRFRPDRHETVPQK